MSAFIDHVRCGACDIGLVLDSQAVVVQRYRRRAWLRHFWVYCDVCAAHKLYWPTARQLRLADGLGCRTLLADSPEQDVVASYARAQGLPVVERRPSSGRRDRETAFLLAMLAATCRPTTARTSGVTSYLPAHWAN